MTESFKSYDKMKFETKKSINPISIGFHVIEDVINEFRG